MYFSVPSVSVGLVVSSGYPFHITLKIPAPIHMISLTKFEVKEIEMSRSPRFELVYDQTLDVNLKESVSFCF